MSSGNTREWALGGGAPTASLDAIQSTYRPSWARPAPIGQALSVTDDRPRRADTERSYQVRSLRTVPATTHERHRWTFKRPAVMVRFADGLTVTSGPLVMLSIAADVTGLWSAGWWEAALALVLAAAALLVLGSRSRT